MDQKTQTDNTKTRFFCMTDPITSAKERLEANNDEMTTGAPSSV